MCIHIWVEVCTELIPSKLYNSTSTSMQFRYTAPTDWLLMLLGFTAAVAAGVISLLLVVYYGEVLNSFINQSITSAVFSTIPGDSENCTELFPALNVTEIFEELNCHYNPSIHDTYSDVIRGCYGERITCLNNAAFLDEINLYMVVFLCISMGAFLSNALAIFLLQVTSERRVLKTRLSLYHSILQQEIGWFDSIGSGSLFSILTT